MQLAAVKLKNWLAFEQASISLGDARLTFLVGPNNSGKSAFLASIDKVITPSGDFRGLRSGSETGAITVEFLLDPNERRAVIQAATNDPKRIAEWVASDAFGRVSFVFTLSSRSPSAHLSEVQATFTSGPFVPIISHTPGVQEIRHTRLQQLVSSGTPRDASLDGTVHLANAIEGLERMAGRSELEPFLGWLQAWRANTFHFQAVRPGSPGTGQTQFITSTLDTRGENLAEVLHWIKVNDDTAWSEIKRVISDLVPGVGELNIDSTLNETRVYFVDRPGSDRRVYLKSVGTGVEQLLMLVIVGVRQPSGGLVILEEPETGLHAEAQRWFLSYLRNWSRDRQILASTHSTIFLDRTGDVEASVWTVRRNTGKSTLENAASDNREVLTLLGVRLGDFFSADALILVEGPSDVAIFEAWFGTMLHEGNVRLIEAPGGDRVWHVDSLIAWLAKASELRARALFVRDRDELNRAAVKSLTDTGAVVVLSRREIENFFLDDVKAIRHVIESRRTSQANTAPTWDGSNLEAQIEATGATSMSRTVLKRVANDLAGRRLLPRRSVNTLLASAVSRQAVREHARARLIYLKDIDAAWRKHERDVQKEWPSKWRTLVEGSEVLSDIWRSAGLAYDKEKDGAALASLVRPPHELREAIKALLSRA